ncbi:hypothetical protein H2201_000813 [Coniosporium apollinis]|uniref:2EXR domain-containing protein n=1 Tax=Coniosporium apollinis TaxID=61459 RepID=A0ABQ9P2Z7_9PEZI|nr:hypothetical protein H2201_000813 [Coniosporium apollinis]
MGHDTRLGRKQFRQFSSLPAELRCMIWQFAAAECLDGNFQISFDGRLTKQLSKAGVLTASREAQHEVESFFYGQIVFTYKVISQGVSPLRVTLGRLAARTRRQIKHIVVHHPPDPALRLLQSLFNIFEDEDLRARMSVVLCCSSVEDAKRKLEIGRGQSRWYKRKLDKAMDWYFYHDTPEGVLMGPGYTP